MNTYLLYVGIRTIKIKQLFKGRVCFNIEKNMLNVATIKGKNGNMLPMGSTPHMGSIFIPLIVAPTKKENNFKA